MHFLDYVAEEDLPALYQSALAFVYPSLMEGFGLPVLEAMASGTPVVVSDVEPLASLVGDGGWLVPAENVDAWQSALAEAVMMEDKRRFFGAEGKRRAAGYSWDRVARETMNGYQAFLARPLSGASGAGAPPASALPREPLGRAPRRQGPGVVR